MRVLLEIIVVTKKQTHAIFSYTPDILTNKTKYPNSSFAMYQLSPLLAFAATNGELKRRLREEDYGTVKEHLNTLNKYKMFIPAMLHGEAAGPHGTAHNSDVRCPEQPGKDPTHQGLVL